MNLILALLLALTTSGCAIIYADRYIGNGGGDTVVLCHKGGNTLELPREAAAAHLNHGDTYGPC
jgi:hypothetical protein